MKLKKLDRDPQTGERVYWGDMEYRFIHFHDTYPELGVFRHIESNRKDLIVVKSKSDYNSDLLVVESAALGERP